MRINLSTIRDCFLVLVFISLMLIIVNFLHAAPGDIRKTVATDSSGNVLSTPLSFSNQVLMVVAPTLPNHLARLADIGGGSTGSNFNYLTATNARVFGNLSVDILVANLITNISLVNTNQDTYGALTLHGPAAGGSVGTTLHMVNVTNLDRGYVGFMDNSLQGLALFGPGNPNNLFSFIELGSTAGRWYGRDYIQIQTSSGGDVQMGSSGGSVSPIGDDIVNLGIGSRRWNNIKLGTGASSNSGSWYQGGSFTVATNALLGGTLVVNGLVTITNIPASTIPTAPVNYSQLSGISGGAITNMINAGSSSLVSSVSSQIANLRGLKPGSNMTITDEGGTNWVMASTASGGGGGGVSNNLILLRGWAAYGSGSSSAAVRFSTHEQIYGGYVSVDSNAVTATVMTVLANGTYIMVLNGGGPANNATCIGITRNSADMTASPIAFNYPSNVVCVQTVPVTGNASTISCTAIEVLASNDLIRVQTSGGTPADKPEYKFYMRKLE